MDFKKLLIKRRSIRKYKEKLVSPETITKIIEDAVCAPSSRNDQPWKFIIITNKVLMKKISDEAKKIILARTRNNPDDYAKKYESMLEDVNFNIFFNAPSVVLIAGDKNLKNMKINCSLAGCYFILSAASRGLGTCWVNFATVINSSGLLNELGIPADCEIAAAITVGHPLKIPPMPFRRPIEILNIIR